VRIFHNQTIIFTQHIMQSVSSTYWQRRCAHQRRAPFVLRWMIAPWYVTSHPGQLSLRPSAGWKMSTSQGAVAAFFGRKIIVGLASHRPCVRDCSTRLPYQLSDLRKKDEHLLTRLYGFGNLYIYVLHSVKDRSRN